MLTIVLIRPGSTEYDAQRRIPGNLDLPMCRQGEEEVAELTQQLSATPLVAVYHGLGQSAAKTAAAVAQNAGCKVTELSRLANIDLGLWQGTLIDEIKKNQPKVYRQWQENPRGVCPPQGEMLEEAVARVAAALAKIQKKHKEGTVALVVSEPLASIARNELTGEKLGDLWSTTKNAPRWEAIPVPAKELAKTH